MLFSGKSFDMQKNAANHDLLSSLPQAVAGIHLVGHYRDSTPTYPANDVDRWDICQRSLLSDCARFFSVNLSLVSPGSPVLVPRRFSGALLKRTVTTFSRLCFRREMIRQGRASQPTSLLPRPDFSLSLVVTLLSLPRLPFSSI
jgi:hypothetical protein